MNDEVNPEMEKKWQDYLRRRRIGKYVMALGVVILLVSVIFLAIPVAVAAYSGTIYVETPWENYLGFSILIGIFLIVVGLVSMIAPNMMEGDALWIFKLGPFDKGW